MKLTKPQLYLLIDVSDGCGQVDSSYVPTKKLVELGLCVWQEYGSFGNSKLVITEAGRAALSEGRDNG